jgi:hypothetical protein
MIATCASTAATGRRSADHGDPRRQSHPARRIVKHPGHLRLDGLSRHPLDQRQLDPLQ